MKRVLSLGQELKRWEQLFAASHHGSKPTRADIKQDAEIASKYSEYHRLRGKRSANNDTQKTSLKVPKERKAHPRASDSTSTQPISASTPSKVRQTPVSTTTSPRHTNDENLPSVVDESTFVGPTPQKNGRALGLFDLLPEETTPLTRRIASPKRDAQSPLRSLDINAVASTPSKTRSLPSDDVRHAVEAAEDTLHMINEKSRTPQSSGKRFLLEYFVTPSKRRRLNESDSPQSENRHVHSATPSFLQRSVPQTTMVIEPSSALDATVNMRSSGNATMRQPPGPRKKPLARSFSTMIADIRRAEDNRLDEELDMLREMEAVHDSEQQFRATHHPAEKVLVEDSQVAHHALGPDGTGLPNEDQGGSEEGLGRDGKPLKIWKKRGQKRQTRRVVMRPTTRVASSAAPGQTNTLDGKNGDMNIEDWQSTSPALGKKGVVHVAETKIDNDEDGPLGVDPFSEDELAGNGLLPKQRTSSGQNAGVELQGQPEALGTKARASKASGNIVQKAVKKISATAHANYRRLKIKSSKGAKAAGKTRYGRGRR